MATPWCVPWSGAQICDEFLFDSTRGHPGKGPSSPTSAGNVFLGNGRNTNSTGDSRELPPTEDVHVDVDARADVDVDVDVDADVEGGGA